MTNNNRVVCYFSDELINYERAKTRTNLKSEGETPRKGSLKFEI
jgi:hypothetical protein